FPQTNLQVRDLYELGIQMFVPAGSFCGGGSPRFQLVLADSAGVDHFVYVISPITGNCSTGQWLNLDFLGAPGAYFDASGVGGSDHTTRTGAHVAAVGSLGGNYKIRVVRMQFDASGDEAW